MSADTVEHCIASDGYRQVMNAPEHTSNPAPASAPTGRNKFGLSFYGGADVTDAERDAFVGLVKAAWPTVTGDQLDTLREQLDLWPVHVIEVYYRPGREALMLSVTDKDAWSNVEAPPSVFGAKIEDNGSFA
jgi:hypothetical protein